MAMENTEIKLQIEGQVFKVNKHVLCEHSDYFRAMFSGNFSEKEKQEISIDVVDAGSMHIILKYMRIGVIDLSEYSLPTVGELAISANFLQITELVKQIEYCLDTNLSAANWVETMCIAENASYLKLEERAAAYGLYDFKFMMPKYISPVEKLVWYLSHSFLNAESELQVFKFGVEWIYFKEAGADALLLILGCLDMSRITKEDLHKMKHLTKEYVNSLAEKVIDCLHKLVSDFQLSVNEIKKNKAKLCEMFTERVYTEVLSLVTDSRKREIKFQPCVALWADEKDTNKDLSYTSNYLHKFNVEDGFTPWLETGDTVLWGWNVVAWGPTKIVVVCGEHGKGTGMFWKGIKVYDVLRKEWIVHGVELPVRRHGGAAIVGDNLYIIGGVGGYRRIRTHCYALPGNRNVDLNFYTNTIMHKMKIVLDSAIIYNLKERTFRKIAHFHDAIQSPATCTHDNTVYVGGHRDVYCYDDTGDHDRWVKVLETNMKLSCMISFKGYIYCTQNYFVNLYRFRPGVDTNLGTLETIECFSNAPATLCHLGDRLLAFTKSNGAQANLVTVEEYRAISSSEAPKVIWSKNNCGFTIKEVSGSCVVIDKLPPTKNEFTPYLKRTLANYEACYPN